MIHSKQHRGCRIQDSGTRGYRGWKTAGFSHSAGTAQGEPPLNRCSMGCSCTFVRPRVLVPSADPPVLEGLSLVKRKISLISLKSYLSTTEAHKSFFPGSYNPGGFTGVVLFLQPLS